MEVGRYLPKGVLAAVALAAVVLAVELGGESLTPVSTPGSADSAAAE
jgi:hypothetical protein